MTTTTTMHSHQPSCIPTNNHHNQLTNTGEVIIHEKQPMIHVYFVKEGLVSITLPGSTAHAVHAAQRHAAQHTQHQLGTDVDEKNTNEYNNNSLNNNDNPNNDNLNNNNNPNYNHESIYNHDPSIASNLTNDDDGALRLHVRFDIRDARGPSLPRPDTVQSRDDGGGTSLMVQEKEVAVVGANEWFCEAALLGNPPYPV